VSSKTAGSRARALVAGAVTITSLTFASGAFAQVSPADAAVAQSMFDEGRRLMSEKRYAEACPKLADSQRLDPALGTLLNLAVCHEKLGRTASAWTEYRDAESIAKREGRLDRAAYAREHVAQIEPHLSHVTVVRGSNQDGRAAEAGLDVRLDDASVGLAALGTALPIDPGEHKIEARAPGKITWTGTVTVGADAASTKVEIPILADEPKPEPVVIVPPPVVAPPVTPPPAQPPPDVTPPPETPHGMTTRRTIAYAIGGVGIAGLAAGSIAGIETISKWSTRNDACPGDRCTPAGLDADKTARSWALVSDVGFAVGVVGVGVATYLILTEPSQAAPPATTGGVRIVPRVGANSGGLSIAGAW
jgi:hypothetical protein